MAGGCSADPAELAGDDHQCLAHAGGETAVGLHGEHDLAFADEFQWHRARIKFQRAAAESQGLGLFVRSLVGLDRQAATEALGSFLQDKALGSNQMEFLNLIVNHLTERGVMDPALLYEPPFTGYAPQGPEALFTRAQVNQLFQTLDHIKTTATVAQRA